MLSHACLSITPAVRASAGLAPLGMFSASTLPDSISSSRGGSRRSRSAGVISDGFRGQKMPAVSGTTKIPRNTDRPAMIDERSFWSRRSHSVWYQIPISFVRISSAPLGALTFCWLNATVSGSLDSSHPSPLNSTSLSLAT